MSRIARIIAGYCLLIPTGVGTAGDPVDHVKGGTSIAFAPDGKTVAIGGLDSRVRIWNCQTNRVAATLIGHEGFITSVAFQPDGTALASGSEDGTIRFWDLKGEEERRFEVPNSCESEPTFTSIHRVTRSLTHNLVDNLPLDSKVPSGRRVTAIAFAPDGQTLAAGQDSGVVRLWDVDSGRLRASWQAHDYRIGMLAYAPNGRELATRGGERTRTWDLATHRMRLDIHQPRSFLGRLAYSPNGQDLALSDGSNISIREAATGLEKMLIPEPNPHPADLIYHPSGTSLFLADTSGIKALALSRPGAGFEALTVLLPGIDASLAIDKKGSRLAFCVARLYPSNDPDFGVLPLNGR